jgi:hypothetical protein
MPVFVTMIPHRSARLQDHSQAGNEMVTTHFTVDTKTLICKQLSKLPPVVNDWQQSCKQPQCSHYSDGECCKAGRQSASAPCPFDGKELLLVDAETVNSNDATPDASPLLPCLATPAVPKKG